MYSIYKKGLAFIILVSVILSAAPICSAYAANLKFYNYSTNKNETYTGKQVIYTCNTREAVLDYPGIIINGTALADYEDLFVSELGLQAKRSGEKITFSDGITELTLTMGSKKVQINGATDTMSVAPVKLKFNDNIKYYVPTRFVAETFGYDYVWATNVNTARITKTLQLVCDNKNVTYNGTIYSVSYKNEKIYTDMPVIYYNGNVMVPAKQVFEAAGCTYAEQNNIISILKDELTLHIELNNRIAYVNEKKIIGNSEPIQITEMASGKTESYIALEFAADLLGFELAYTDKYKCYTLTENEFTGKLALYPDLQNGLSVEKTTEPKYITMNENQPENIYFVWSATESIETMDSETNYLSKVRAYAMENADVVELYGISRDNIFDFFDSGLVIFELNNVVTDIETEYFMNDEATYLNYALLTSLKNSTKIYFDITVENEWTILETADGVRVFFSKADLSENDLLISSVGQKDVNENVQENIYPDDKIIIPTPETIEISHISDEDIYWEKRFLIKLVGNHEDFYKNALIINPYYGIDISNIYYDFVNNLTILEFNTKYLCGYKYTHESGYIALEIGKPGDLYSKVVILDAGHGGIDPGASKSGVKEKDVNYKIINIYTAELFKESDIKVYFTRKSDIKIDLYERAALASIIGADMFISLHLNSNNSSSVSGTEVYYSTDNNATSATGLNSYQLAKVLLDSLTGTLKSKNRGVKTSDFIVTKYNTVPAVLIELGYMSNKTELSKLADETYQKKAAQAIYQTVTKLFETYN